MYIGGDSEKRIVSSTGSQDKRVNVTHREGLEEEEMLDPGIEV